MINKKKHRLFKSPSAISKPRASGSNMYSKGVLAGSFYNKCVRSKGKDESKDLHVNSMVKARLQGNIMDIIKRTAEEKSQKEKRMETVIELPSKLFSSTRDIPDISLFQKPKKKENPCSTNSLTELQNTIQFQPPVTSTPFLQGEAPSCSKKNNTFESNMTPLPFALSQKNIKEESNHDNVTEKYNKMCEIINFQCDMINILLASSTTQFTNTKQELRKIFLNFKNRRHESSFGSEEHHWNTGGEFNKTYVISRDDPTFKSPNNSFSLGEQSFEKSFENHENLTGLNNSFEFITQTVQNPKFSPECLPFFDTSDKFFPDWSSHSSSPTLRNLFNTSNNSFFNSF